MDRSIRWSLLGLLLLVAAGCQSPYYADRGALFGGLLGAGTGAIVGSAVHNPGAGAAIGAGVGALTGAAVGSGMDEIEAKNRAAIAAQMGREIPPGAVTIDDVIAMSRAGVAEDLIINHIRANGMVRPPNTQDLIALQQQGVSTRVIAAMQEPPPVRREPVYVAEPAPAPVIVEEYHYGPPWYYRPPYYRYHYYHHRPGVSWGLSFSN